MIPGSELDRIMTFTRADIALLVEAYRELRELAEALVNKLEEINNHDAYKAVWIHYSNHGLTYRGPQYSEERNALAAYLKGDAT